MDYFLQNIKNIVDFFLRQNLTISRKNYFEINEDKEGLFEEYTSQKNIIEREKFLHEKYDLSYLKNNSTRQNYLENLYTIDVLDKYLTLDFQENIRALDIGCKNWCYARGEYAFFKKFCNNLQLDGVEIDPNRLYSNFYSRKEVAKFYIKGLDHVNYIEENFLGVNARVNAGVNKKYDYIVWVLPFVVKEPLLKWGLPLKYFQPEKMLEHAYKLLNENGMIFIINQGESEYDIQVELCKKLNITFTPIGKIDSDFWNYEISRYALIIKK